MTTRSRAWCFTCNNYTYLDMREIIETGNQRYIIIGFEVGKKGTSHLQGYVYFANAVTFQSLNDHNSTRFHWEQAKGTPEQNQTYCSKTGNYLEFGELPIKGHASWESIEDAMKDPMINPRLYVQYKKHYKEIINMSKEKKTTKFYVIDPIGDAITEVYDYFNWEETDKVAIVTDLNQLEAYDEYDHVIYYSSYLEQIQNLWPRGVPITYKYGYEIKKLNCDSLTIVTSTPSLYPLYKNIH